MKNDLIAQFNYESLNDSKQLDINELESIKGGCLTCTTCKPGSSFSNVTPRPDNMD